MKTKGYATIQIEDKNRGRADRLTVRQAITILHASKSVDLEDITTRDMAKVVSNVYGMAYDRVIRFDRAAVKSFFTLFLDEVRSLGLLLTGERQAAKDAATDAQPLGTFNVGGHVLSVPFLVDNEVAGMWLDLEDMIEAAAKAEEHDVELMPKIIGTLCREPGTIYDGSTNAGRTELVMDMLMTDAARITAFFFASSIDFARLVTARFPGFQSWIALNSALVGTDSLLDGEGLRHLFASLTSSPGSTPPMGSKPTALTT